MFGIAFIRTALHGGTCKMQSRWIQERQRDPREESRGVDNNMNQIEPQLEGSPVLDRAHRFEDSRLSSSLHFTVLMSTFTHILAYGVRRFITKLVEFLMWPMFISQTLPLVHEKNSISRHRAMILCIDDDNIMTNAVVDVAVSERMSVTGGTEPRRSGTR